MLVRSKMEQNGAVNCANCKLRAIALSILPMAATINGKFLKRPVRSGAGYTIRDKCGYRLNLIATKCSFHYYLRHLVASRNLISKEFACVPSPSSYYAKHSRSSRGDIIIIDNAYSHDVPWISYVWVSAFRLCFLYSVCSLLWYFWEFKMR